MLPKELLLFLLSALTVSTVSAQANAGAKPSSAPGVASDRPVSTACGLCRDSVESDRVPISSAESWSPSDKT